MKPDDGGHPHELISAFHDRLTTAQESAELKEHLRDCPDCRRFLHDLSGIAAAIGEEAVPLPPADLAERVRKRIEASSASQPSSGAIPFRRSPIPLAAAATILMAFTLWMVWRRETPAVSSPSPSVARSPQALAQTPPAKSNGQAISDETAQGLQRLGYLEPRDKQPSTAPVPQGIAPPEAAHPPVLPRVDTPASDAGSEQGKPTALLPSERVADAVPSPSPKAAGNAMLDKVLSSGLTGEGYRKATEGKGRAGVTKEKAEPRSVASRTTAAPAAAAEGPAGDAASQGARSLAYEGPAFSATFTEDGDVTVIARGFACSVTVPEHAEAPTAGGKRPESIEDLSALFSVAGSPEFLSAPVARPEGGNASASAPIPVTASSLALRDGEGDSIHSVQFLEPLSQDSPHALQTLRHGIQTLILERYRKQIEARCGPLPAGVVDSR